MIVDLQSTPSQTPRLTGEGRPQCVRVLVWCTFPLALQGMSGKKIVKNSNKLFTCRDEEPVSGIIEDP